MPGFNARRAVLEPCRQIYDMLFRDTCMYAWQVLLHNKQVYHMAKRTIELDVNTYLTIDPKVPPFCCSKLCAEG